MNKELFAKAKEAKSAEEFLSLAKKNGIEMTEDSAKVLYERMNTSGELSDDELNSVSGGGCSDIFVYKIDNPNTACPKCGKREVTEGPIGDEQVCYCHDCRYTWVKK